MVTLGRVTDADSDTSRGRTPMGSFGTGEPGGPTISDGDDPVGVPMRSGNTDDAQIQAAVDTEGAEVSAEPVPPEPVAEPEPALSEVESVICGVFVGYCADALAVARCESGPDYWAGVGVHAGTFQIAVAYHAGRFAVHGWDIWADGSDYYRNSVVAYDLFAARGYSWLGTSGWPNCGWEAGY